jgi:hypothetical protein
MPSAPDRKRRLPASGSGMRDGHFFGDFGGAGDAVPRAWRISRIGRRDAAFADSA